MLGVDIVDVNRISRLIEHKNFFRRMFTEKEIKYIESKNFNSNTIAGLIASKESVAKAFGVGISSKLVFKDIEILHDNLGKPYVSHENINIQNLLKKNKLNNIEINLSHDGNYAIATAIINKKTDTKINTPFKYKGFLKRKDDSNKHDYGRILIIGGKLGMTGSVVLSSKAALRAGAGLVYLLVPECIRNIVENKTMEQIILSIKDDGKSEFGKFETENLLNIIQDKSVIAIGTGLGTGIHAKKILDIIIKYFTGPIVVDADAINILSMYPELITKDLYITPHNMEFARLSGYTLNEIEYDRINTVKNFLDRYDVNILLKGKDTIIANRNYLNINTTGNNGMSTTGTGDVLTGIVAAFLARHNNYQMFQLAAFVHGLAGDIAADKIGKTSLIASDLIDYLPEAFGELDYDD